jgi:two-component system, chemotaxis family, chemotaxis protein CheY
MRSRVLIVDDDARIRRILREFLESRSDWEICGEAENGAVAVTKARQLNPDIILMDFAMPEMDGLHAAQEISAFLPGTPIILHTMHANETMRGEGQRYGVQIIISKGTSPLAIAEAMKSALAGAAAKSPAVDDAPAKTREDAEADEPELRAESAEAEKSDLEKPDMEKSDAEMAEGILPLPLDPAFE